VKKVIKEKKAKYLIYIKKSIYKLFIIDDELNVVRDFDIAVGKKKKFGAKRHAGDRGTPEGLYHVKEVLSAAANEESNEYIKLKRMNNVLFKAEDDHSLFGKPEVDAGKNVYGPRFFRLNYPNEDDKVRYRDLKAKGKIPKNSKGEVVGMGYGIGIHGTNDPVSIGHKFSSGCIRMKNHEVVILDRYIRLMTPVIIEK
jgi:murein L,D-transpeptidase YafK